jgi:hypothetical protein
MNATQRRAAYARALAQEQAQRRPPVCQRCTTPITGKRERSQFLHNRCAERLESIGYLAAHERKALDKYNEEVQAVDPVTTRSQVTAAGSAPVAVEDTDERS